MLEPVVGFIQGFGFHSFDKIYWRAVRKRSVINPRRQKPGRRSGHRAAVAKTGPGSGPVTVRIALMYGVRQT
jgi:hypothetical protein